MPLRAMSEAEQALLLRHVGLVKYFVRRMKRPREPMDDLLQEGYLAMIRATQTWRPELGEMATHFRWMLRRQLSEYRTFRGSAIKVPGWYAKAMRRGEAPAAARVDGGDHSETLAGAIDDSGPDPSEASRRESRRRTRAALARLSRADRRAVCMLARKGNRKGAARLLGTTSYRLQQSVTRAAKAIEPNPERWV